MSEFSKKKMISALKKMYKSQRYRETHSGYNVDDFSRLHDGFILYFVDNFFFFFFASRLNR